MKKNRNSSPRAFALRATASIALISVATVLFASGFNGMFNSSPATTNPLASQAIPHPVYPANQRSVDATSAIWVLGDVFAGVAGGNYQVYDNAGTFKETINNAINGFTTGCQFNPPLTQLYTTAFGSGQLVKFADADPHPTSNVATPVWGVRNPWRSKGMAGISSVGLLRRPYSSSMLQTTLSQPMQWQGQMALEARTGSMWRPIKPPSFTTLKAG